MARLRRSKTYLRVLCIDSPSRPSKARRIALIASSSRSASEAFLTILRALQAQNSTIGGVAQSACRDLAKFPLAPRCHCPCHFHAARGGQRAPERATGGRGEEQGKRGGRWPFRALRENAVRFSGTCGKHRQGSSPSFRSNQLLRLHSRCRPPLPVPLRTGPRVKCCRVRDVVPWRRESYPPSI